MRNSSTACTLGRHTEAGDGAKKGLLAGDTGEWPAARQ